MKAGTHAAALPSSLLNADICYIVTNEQSGWDECVVRDLKSNGVMFFKDTLELTNILTCTAKDNDVVVFMSNGGFDNVFIKFHQLLYNK